MKEYYRGATVYLQLTVTGIKDPYTLTTPDGGCTVDIFNENGVKEVSAGAMTAASTGVYYYNWTIPADQAKGIYTARGIADHGSLYSVDELQIRVK